MSVDFDTSLTSTFINPGYAVGYVMLHHFSDTDFEYIWFLFVFFYQMDEKMEIWWKEDF